MKGWSNGAVHTLGRQRLRLACLPKEESYSLKTLLKTVYLFDKLTAFNQMFYVKTLTEISAGVTLIRKCLSYYIVAVNLGSSLYMLMINELLNMLFCVCLNRNRMNHHLCKVKNVYERMCINRRVIICML